MTILVGIFLAVLCALATNVGFLYKHRGACAAPAVDMRRPLRSARSLFASPLFAIGMAIATGAWIFHVAAMALTAVGLVLLGVTLPATHGADSRFSLPAMIAFEAGLIAGGSLLIMGPRIGAPRQHHGYMLGAAVGILFGVSEVAIKAISGLVGSAGLMGLVSPWTLVCVIASVAAFYASAKGLQDGQPVPVIAVTGTAANVSGIVGGILVFGDPLSGHPLMFAAEG